MTKVRRETGQEQVEEGKMRNVARDCIWSKVDVSSRSVIMAKVPPGGRAILPSRCSEIMCSNYASMSRARTKAHTERVNRNHA